MDIDVNAIYLTLLVFGVKLIFILLITFILNCNEKRGANLAIAWITSYLYEIAAMFTLSFFKRLYALELVLIMAIGLMIAGIYLSLKSKKRIEKQTHFLHICFSDVIPLTIMVAFCIYCVARAFIYFDTTPDAGAYGMPRIFLFSNSGSLFVNMGTWAKNIFVNEWNGELNAVFYRVLTGNNISIPFANIETYFYATLSFIFLGKDLFKEKRYSIYPAYLVMFLPTVVFLAYTCKGDLLGMVTFPIYILILFLYWKEERIGISSYQLLYGVVISGALATGARITTIPAVGLIMLIVLGDFCFRKKYGEIRVVLLSACIAYVTGWGRYIINFLYYGNFFERVDVSNETVAPSISRFCTTLVNYIKDIVWGENIYTHEGIMWALNADAGILGIFILIAFVAGLVWLVYRFIHKRELLRKYWKEMGICLVLLLTIAFMLCSMDYYSWSFRYFAPYFICILVGLLYILNFVNNKHVVKACWGLILVLGTINAYSTISMAGLQGEVTGDTWDNMLQKEEIQRRLAFHEWLVENPEGESDINDFYDSIRENKKVLICNSIAQVISWCWGDNASNEVTICLPQDLNEYYLKENWDAIVVTQMLDMDKSFIPAYLYEHYVPYGLGFDVYIRKDREIYQDAFRACNFSENAMSSGVYSFDGEYCWLDIDAELPINIDVSKGVKITYAAGIDLEVIDNTTEPQINIYVDGQFWDSMGVEYTGEYEVQIPVDAFDETLEYHLNP